MSRYKVANKEEDAEDDMLGDGNDIGSGHFCDSNLLFIGSVEVNMIRSDTGSDTELEVLGLWGVSRLSETLADRTRPCRQVQR